MVSPPCRMCLPECMSCPRATYRPQFRILQIHSEIGPSGGSMTRKRNRLPLFLLFLSPCLTNVHGLTFIRLCDQSVVRAVWRSHQSKTQLTFRVPRSTIGLDRELPAIRISCGSRRVCSEVRDRLGPRITCNLHQLSIKKVAHM